MPIRRSCSFCGNDIEPGTGKMFIRKDGTIFLFCSSKCQANLLALGRVPRWTPWTQAARRAAGVAAVPAEASVVEEAPAAAPEADVAIETPKGKDIPSDLVDLIDKRLGPDLSRGDIERYFAGFVGSGSFRHSMINAAKKAHAGKTTTRIEKSQFLAWKDSAEGRRVFKAWLDGEWANVKGKKRDRDEEPPAPAARKAKKGA
ncbi:MAG: hypothetical protein A3K68_07225 [Euryarchaeota archaeon RBG_16_68_13]|nr:MAG: hypothetical protein A3K68_07225 [Euryarchaeota archaeon RBG_16_68_13]